MLTRIFWVPEADPCRLAIMPRPAGGEALAKEIKGWQAAGLNTIVSLLEPTEATYLELGEEKSLCEGAGMEFLSFPITDRGLPSDFAQTTKFVEQVTARLRDGKSVAVHCRVGIGRSGMIGACILLHLGHPYHQVFPSLSKARGLDVPDTVEQSKWVYDYSLRLTIDPVS